jgi:PIN domain nuclease of toxin-antitoxin system
VTRVVADTHAVVWLLSEPDRLSPAAVSALRRALSGVFGVVISTISLVEMVYLIERRRIDPRALDSLRAASASPVTALELVALDEAVAIAVERIPRDIVADMPDRIIAATALALGLPLVTRDAAIRRLGIETVW